MLAEVVSGTKEGWSHQEQRGHFALPGAPCCLGDMGNSGGFD